ncbi:MAG: DUF6785 family protein [bacterium]
MDESRNSATKYLMTPKNVSLRPIVISLIIIPVNALWLILMEEFRYSGHPTTASLSFNVIFWLFLLTLINFILKKITPKFALRRGELLIIYVMLAIASSISGHDALISLPSVLGHAYWFATPENEWQDLFWQYIPYWLAVKDSSVLSGYYQGESSFYNFSYIKKWLIPMAWWSAFYFVLLYIMLCINVIFRKQWTEVEKLSYPVIQLPLEMTQENTNRLIKNKMFWIGFTIAGIIDLVNGFHFLLPVVPEIRVKQYDISYLFTEKPWNAIGWTPISFYPFAIGLCFFAPLDLLFSTWFFYLFGKAQRIFGSVIGVQKMQGFPYYDQQVFGAAFGIFIMALWANRRHLAQVIKASLGILRIDDLNEPIKYRSAIIGIIIGISIIIMFCIRAGMSFWVIPIYFFIYYMLWITITRIRAQLGPPVHDFWSYTSGQTFGHPDMMLVSFFGTRRLGNGTLTMFSFFWWFNKGFRGHPAPHQLEAFKLSEQGKMENRITFIAIVIATIAGIISCLWVMMHYSYKFGAPGVHYYGGIYFDSYLSRWLTHPETTDFTTITAMLLGLIFTIFLSTMRLRFIGWQLHPVGYALSGSWTMNLVWFVFLTTWIIKFIILKYGGLSIYRRATPIFLGLILGEFIVGSIWTIVGIIFDIPSYAFWY